MEKHNGNGHHEIDTENEFYNKDKYVPAEDLDEKGAYFSPHQTDNIKLLMTPGTDVLNLLMRADVPNRKFAVAVSSLIKKCRDHGDKEGELEVLSILAGLVAVGAKRAGLVGDVLIGQKGSASKSGWGLADKLKKMAGLNTDE